MLTEGVKSSLCMNYDPLLPRCKLELRYLLLCLKTLMVAPDNLEPRTREVWLSSSLKMRQPWEKNSTQYGCEGLAYSRKVWCNVGSIKSMGIMIRNASWVTIQKRLSIWKTISLKTKYLPAKITLSLYIKQKRVQSTSSCMTEQLSVQLMDILNLLLEKNYSNKIGQFQGYPKSLIFSVNPEKSLKNM